MDLMLGSLSEGLLIGLFAGVSAAGKYQLMLGSYIKNVDIKVLSTSAPQSSILWFGARLLIRLNVCGKLHAIRHHVKDLLRIIFCTDKQYLASLQIRLSSRLPSAF
jgi:hypothetical protein